VGKLLIKQNGDSSLQNTEMRNLCLLWWIQLNKGQVLI